MSQNTELDPYYQTGVAGVDHRDIDSSGEGHPFGDSPKEWTADLRPLIKQVAEDLYDTWEATVREYLANAETACLKVENYLEKPNESPFDDMIVSDGYNSTIEVTWNRSKQKLIIQDNGIGMAAAEVDQVFRHIGRSAARDIGTMSGAFGMGALSFQKFIGTGNTMVMKSHSRLNDDNASYLVTLAGIEPVRGSLGDDEYGTRFELDQRSDDMDVRAAVEKYAKNMRVPVLYREIDENGEEVFNEDWGEHRLFDDYKEGKYVDEISEEEAFKAYMSESAEGRTLLLSMEIDRNSATKSVYPFDVRILDESGRVVRCGCDDADHNGLIPIPRLEYEEVLLESRPDHITEELLSDKDVVAYPLDTVEFYDYAVEEEVLESGEALPVAEYALIGQINDEDLIRREVIIGPHSGREVVSADEWEELPQGRAAQFVPENELSEFDVETGEGDLTLPTPTTDRSSLQSNPKFWKYLARTFDERWDEKVQKFHELMERAENGTDAIEKMEVPTVSDIRGDA